MTTGRLTFTMHTMNASKTRRPAGAADTPSGRVDRLTIWILLAVGLLLMLVSVGKAEQPSATRVDRFQGAMRPGQTLHIENVSGDIVASAGKAFSAAVTVTVSAPTQQRADEILAKTHVRGDHDDDGWNLETRWPGMNHTGMDHNGRDTRHGSSCSQCRVLARYEVVVPPGVTAELHTVNGDVRVRECDGDLELESVNGSIDARGVRGSINAQTVNGRIAAEAHTLGAKQSVELQSVNGAVTLILPKDARFDFSASTMNGTIASSFPLPRPAAEAGDEELGRGEKGTKRERTKRIIVKSDGEDTTVIDLHELEQELEQSMRDVEVSVEDGARGSRDVREAQREMRRMRVTDPRREYSGSIGKGGAGVQMETLNGTILLLASGTQESEAKTLVTERRSFVVTVPSVRVRVPQPHVSVHVPQGPPIPPVPPAPGAPPVAPSPPEPPEADFDHDIVRGNIAGDFLSTSNGANYRIGNVSGRARILTHSGEIRLGSVGAGADLKSYGGDVVAGSVTGDFKASTAAGDIRAENVSGGAVADTAGGDIRIQSVGGGLDAKTAGGDIVVPRVGGSLRASTGGGDVRVGMVSRQIKGGVTIHNAGGDVTLWLPADCKADVELVVTGADDEDQAIRSDFSDVAISRKNGIQRATASLNGGGEKVVVHTSSGAIRLRKGSQP